MQLPSPVLNALPEQGGTGLELGVVRAHPRLAQSPLSCSGGLLARPGWLPRWCSSPILKFVWAFASILLECAFLIAHFGEFSYLGLQNMYIPNLVKNVSCKPLF